MNSLYAWDCPYVALDIETTGLSPRSCGVVEIGAIRFVPGREGETFQSLVNPGCAIPASATQVHGISEAMVKGQPEVDDVVHRLLDFVGDAPLILHNAPFDLGFLNPIVARIKRRWLTTSVFDTLPLSRLAFPGLRSYSLENLSEHFEFKQGGHHRALADCRYTQMLFLRFLEKVDSLRGFDLDQLASEYATPRLLS